MSRGTRIKPDELTGRLGMLDVDEGIRIESAGKKMFINKNSSGVFVMQFGSDFQYFESTKQVLEAINSKFSRYSAWSY